MAPTEEDIAGQKMLLETHRKTLAHYLMQRAMLSTAFISPGVAHGILEARTNIRHIKKALRLWSLPIDDHPNDEEALSDADTTVNLDTIESWLIQTGVSFVKKLPNGILSVSATTSAKKECIIYIYIDEDKIVFESLVDKIVHGNPHDALRYYQILLMYNAAVSPLYFAIAQISNGQYRLILRTSQNLRITNRDFVVNLVNTFKSFYAEHIAKINEIIAELSLTTAESIDEIVPLVLEEILSRSVPIKKLD